MDDRTRPRRAARLAGAIVALFAAISALTGAVVSSHPSHTQQSDGDLHRGTDQEQAGHEMPAF